MSAATRPQRLDRSADLVEEHVDTFSVLRPRSSELRLDEEAFEHEEFLPYWAELWPSGVALARTVAPRSLRGARTLELGCGLGLASIAAARAGGRVLATDWSREAITFTLLNAQRNAVALEAAVCSWAAPDALVARAPWDLVLASDVLYERRTAELLLALLPRLVGERGEVWLADPRRPPAGAFLEAADATFERRTTVSGQVEIHRLRPRLSARGA